MKIRNGSSRKVLLLGKFAFKFAYGNNKFYFKQGMLANKQETYYSKLDKERFAKVYLSFPFGLLNICQRADELTKEQFASFIFEDFSAIYFSIYDIVEFKRDSFGIVNGKIVAIDYGSVGALWIDESVTMFSESELTI